MPSEETRAILALCLLASFADGEKHEREREEIKRVAQNFSHDDMVHLSTLYQDVLMQRVTLPDVVSRLQSTEAKRLAYEMAVCVCDADGTLSHAEQNFLTKARVALGLDAGAAAAFVQQAQFIAAEPVSGGLVAGAGIGAAASSRVAADVTELDNAILKAAVVNGALELLPETLSTMAIIPLQMKLVWRIGKAYGFELDSGHVKDFLATVGVGLTSQYLEQAGRKLLGGLLGKIGGGMLRGVGQQAVSTGMSFATTYALGQVAKRYYAGGRTLSTQMLKDTYASTLQEAQGLRTRYMPDIQAKAKTLDASSVLSMVRGA
ncbi:YcjF family protein [Rhodoferax antarcticus]|uniref:YcjF family protein n=1 Tax=Rhodoferax antarcticus TaxID=81479 RepID=UPI0011151785|nr:TerB family tellurite resistance protein [Rhodoferax antarcticus]